MGYLGEFEQLILFALLQLGDDAYAFRLLGISVLLAFAAVWTSEWLLRTRRH